MSFTPEFLERQRKLARKERTDQGLSETLEDPAAHARIAAACGLVR